MQQPATWQEYNDLHFDQEGFCWPPPYARQVWRTINGVRSPSNRLLIRTTLFWIGVIFASTVVVAPFFISGLDETLWGHGGQTQYWMWGSPIVGMSLGALVPYLWCIYYRLKFPDAFRGNLELDRWLNAWYLNACEYSIPIMAILVYAVSRLIAA